MGSYGAFFPYYICGISFRASDLQGRTVVFPWVKQETGRCGEAVMHEVSRIPLIRAGIIGVVLVILVIAVGLQPERLVQWATALRYQALFTEAGGIAAGNDVTVSGIKVGSVSSVELDNGDALVGFTIAVNTPSAPIPLPTSAPAPCSASEYWRWNPLEAAHLRPTRHSGHADVVALFADRRGQRAHRQHGGNQYRVAQPVA